MTFEEAISEFKKGKSIRLSTWPKTKCIPGGKHKYTDDSELTFTYYCLSSLDWEVYEEPRKTFSEVFEAFKNGKFIRRKGWMGKQGNINNFYDDIKLSIKDLLATDWEIVE